MDFHSFCSLWRVTAAGLGRDERPGFMLLGGGVFISETLAIQRQMTPELFSKACGLEGKGVVLLRGKQAGIEILEASIHKTC